MPAIRKVIYTANAIGSLNMSPRTLIRNRRIFPNDEAALKSLFVATPSITTRTAPANPRPAG